MQLPGRSLPPSSMRTWTTVSTHSFLLPSTGSQTVPKDTLSQTPAELLTGWIVREIDPKGSQSIQTLQPGQCGLCSSRKGNGSTGPVDAKYHMAVTRHVGTPACQCSNRAGPTGHKGPLISVTGKKSRRCLVWAEQPQE